MSLCYSVTCEILAYMYKLQEPSWL